MIVKEHWRTEKRRDVSGYGKTVTSKVEAYEQTWRSRCYCDGLPDQVPDGLMQSGLAPSWKAAALAILLNRYSLLGIQPTSTIFFGKQSETRPSDMQDLFADNPRHDAH